MEEEYMESQDSSMSEAVNRVSEVGDSSEISKDFGDGGYDESYDDEDGGNNFRGGRGRNNYRGRGRGPPPPNWMNGPPPMRFRGRGYGPGGPPMRGRGFFRGRGGPRFGPNGGPNFDNNWGPMGPPPPGMMGGPPPFGPPPGMMPPGGPMGPPPNMMGQPPPFGGPPGMPPPNMPAPELWVETKSDDGKSYYYHARSRETTWTRPQEGPTCKVITQADMEAMATASQSQMGGPPQMQMGMMGGMPPGMMPPFMSQPPPWAKDGDWNPPDFHGMKDKDGTSPTDSDDMPPGESAPQMQPPNGNMMPFSPSGGFPPGMPPNTNLPVPAGMPSQTPTSMPATSMAATSMPVQTGIAPSNMPAGPPNMNQMPMMNQGGWGGWGGWPPPMMGQPPPVMGNANMPDGGAATQLGNMPDGLHKKDVPSKPKKEEIVIPPELLSAAMEWTTHAAPDGRPYYYNVGKQESVWEKPQPLRELEELQKKIAIEKEKENKAINDKLEVIDVDAHAEAQAQAAAEKEREAQREAEREREKERLEKERIEKERLEKEKAEKERLEKEKADKEKAMPDGNRPVTFTPISGTPWCLVWMRDGQVFFFNPKSSLSTWARPEQLVGREDVDKAINTPPPKILALQKESGMGGLPLVTSTTGGKANGEKRTNSDSDSEPEPAKRARDDVPVKKPQASMLDAEEAEKRAARERALVPLEQRLVLFREMLREQNVSAFSTWEKELHKVVFDARYLLLDSKERKQVFDKYVRERAEEERKEKKNRLQQMKNNFRALMEEAKLNSSSLFSDFSSKYGRDERFKAIDKYRNREAYFNEYIGDVRKKEKEEKERKREQAKGDFIALLKEKSVDRHARWSDAKKKVDSDPRYKAVDSSSLKEDYFREYCKIMKDERKKEKDSKDKERDRSSSKKDKKDKDRDKEREKDKDKEKDKDSKKKKDKADESVESAEPEPEEAAAGSDEEEARQKAARAEASIKEREREVQRVLATSLRDRDKEREYHKRDEAVQHFNALLADLVRNPDLTWHEAKKQLRKDHRYSLADLLKKDDKERLFTAHTSLLSSKRRDKLRAQLAAHGVSCTSSWRSVRSDLAKTAPVYASSAQMEREFRDYQRDLQSAAKTSLRQLLMETRSITHKSLAQVKENKGSVAAITDPLKNDPRYTALDHIPEERTSLVMSYLEELEKKGPPPPPTASEPGRRSKQ